MATQAFISKVTLKRGDGESTEAFTVVPEVLVVPVLGQTKGIVEVTNYDSDDKEYIAELFADGKEVDIKWNMILGDTQQEGVKDDVDNGINRNYEMTVTNGVKTLTSSFTLTPMEWADEVSMTEQSKLSARFKISGAINQATV